MELIKIALFDYDLIAEVRAASWYAEFKERCGEKVISIISSISFPAYRKIRSSSFPEAVPPCPKVGCGGPVGVKSQLPHRTV
jgi:hypothetical protein